MAETNQYDVAIIGAGPGGYVAGIRAAQLGLKACVIEKDSLGGVCLNWGCIPSKNLIKQASVVLSQNVLTDIGVKVDASGLNYSKVQEKSRQASAQLAKGVEFLLKKNKVEVIKGTAKIAGKNKVALDDGTEIAAKNILIATGSRPFTLPGFECDEKLVLSSNGILAMTELPKSLVILGGGVIGCEFAYVMNAFGVKVTIVEMADHILPFEDEEVVAVVNRSFKKKKIDVMEKTKALSLEKSGKDVTVTVEDAKGEKKTITAEKALCVFGRTPNTGDIGLESIGIKTEKGFIPVGDYNQTSAPGVYAIGDVTSSPLLAHVASKEGENAVEHIAGHHCEPTIDINSIPSAIYCEPQVASFGLREFQAKERGINYKKSVFNFAGIGKAVAVGKTEGLVKILIDAETEEILGAHIVGADATEMIHELLLAKVGELLPSDVAGMIHAHPTLSESMMESAKGLIGQPIHS